MAESVGQMKARAFNDTLCLDCNIRQVKRLNKLFKIDRVLCVEFECLKCGKRWTVHAEKENIAPWLLARRKNKNHNRKEG